MPFIWDDFEWKLVDDEESYDKSRFVTVRKLLVKPNKRTPIQLFSVDRIRERVRKFGDIESIEILPGNNTEAYVTFVNDRSAYLMFLQHEFDKKTYKLQPFEIEPADSWEQPQELINQQPKHDMEVDEQIPEIFMLNEDCLLHLFKFLDLDSLVNMANVCKMFNRLLHQHCFPRIQKYEVKNDDDPKFTLVKLHRTMLCIGSHLTDISYEISYDEEDGPGHTSKFLRVIAQNVGGNIRRACFGFQFDKDNRMEIIAPILRNLESLEIVDLNEGSNYDINFQELCPNLIKFIVNMDMTMIACCKPWPSLRSLSVQNNVHLESTTLISFVKQNPQLNSLEFAIDETNKTLLILAVGKYLSRFEKLTIVNANGKFFARNFASLCNLPLLCEINLEKLDKSSLKVILNHLPTFIKLRRISLSCNCSLKGSEVGDYGQSLENLPKKISLLEELKLQRTPINEDTLVEFIGSARHLKRLDIRDGVVIFSDELILKLIDVLKVNRQEANEPLHLYLDKKILNTISSAKYKEFKQYFLVKETHPKQFS